MNPKPGHLGIKYAEQFNDRSIVDMYHHRHPYPEETITKLVSLITDEPRAVLDVGCGTGDLARRLVGNVERVDAIDFSLAMIEMGRTLPGGNDSRLNWIYGRIEEVELQPPYALITAGESLHWMEWEVVLPLFKRILTPGGCLALVSRGNEHIPWQDDVLPIIKRFSTNKEFVPFDLTEELEQRHLFQTHGELRTRPIPYVQSGEAYIQAFHSMNGLSRERMGEEAAEAFDEEVRRVISPFLRAGQLHSSTVSTLVWGLPQDPFHQ